jgi:hypothetical protein
LKGRRRQSQDPVEANIEYDIDEGIEGSEGSVDDDFDHGGDDDAWT